MAWQINPPSTGLGEGEESSLGKLARGAGRTVARGAEAIAGLPGNIGGTTLGLGNYLTGGIIPSYEQAQENIPFLPPTSEQLKRNITEPLTGEYLKPRTNGEEFYDDIVADAATLLLPGGGLLKGGLKGAAKAVGKAALTSTAGNVAGWAAEGLTGSPLLGAGAKLGSFVLASTIPGRKVIDNTIKQSYKTAEQEAKNLSGNPSQLIHEVEKIAEQAKNAENLSSVDREKVTEITNLLKANAIREAENKFPVNNAMESLKRINDLYKDSSPRIEPYLDQINGSLNRFIKESGKNSPQFINAFETAQELYGAQKNVPKLLKTMQNNLTVQKAFEKWAPLSSLGGGIYYLFGRGAAKGAAATLGLAFTGKKAWELINLMQNSPKAARLYKEMWQAAAKNNGLAFANYAKNFDKEAARYGY